MAKNYITMKDWAGNILFAGHFQDKEVGMVLEANRCDKCKGCKNLRIVEKGKIPLDLECNQCEGTGYEGDFEVSWEDEKDTRNVYEFINY